MSSSCKKDAPLMELSKAMSEKIPALTNRYEMQCLIGRGHYGKVVLATLKQDDEEMTDDSSDETLFAIKILNECCRAKSIKNEITYLSRLSGCRNIVEYVEHFEDGGRVAIVTKYFEADHFKTLFCSFSQVEVQRYMRNLLLALKQVHDLQISHGDVKPSNFLFNLEKKKFVLLDFGLVKPFDSPLKQSGTLGYLAPECILKYEKSSAAVDVWSCGIIFAMFLSGLHPIFTEKGQKGLEELHIVFGSKAMNRLGLVLNKSKCISHVLDMSAIQKGIDLRKMCIVFRNYESLHDFNGTHASCGRCKQFTKLCICLDGEGGNEAFFKERDVYPCATYDLLKQMLELDPFKRISVEAALKHPFFQIKFQRLTPQRTCEHAQRIFSAGLVNALNGIHTLPMTEDN